MSLYGQYIQERTDRQIIETDYGFATYAFTDDKTVYIEDIYIIPEHRSSGLASAIADEIAVIAKQKGCSRMMGSVVPSAKNSTDSVKVLIAYGMKLQSSSNNFIIFDKDLT